MIMKNQSPTLKLSLSVLLCIGLISGCTQSDDNTKSESESSAKAPTVAEVYESCDDILFAAMYHLPITHQFFENGDNLIGQPAYFFDELLDIETKESYLVQLNQLYKQSEGSDELDTLHRRLTQWCEAHQSIQNLQQQHGYEEFLAGLYDSDRFAYLFSNHLDSQIFQSDEFSAFDKVASLSSAQGQHIISTLITDLSMQENPQFEQDLTFLKALYSS